MQERTIQRHWQHWAHKIYNEYKKSLKIPKGQSGFLYRRRTDNTMAKTKSTNEQTTINKQSEYNKFLISPNPLTLIHIILSKKKKLFWNRFFDFVALWCLTSLSTIFSNIAAVSFIDEGHRSTRRKPPTCRKLLTNFIT